MGAGARHSALDSHWGGWNWRKVTGFGTEYFDCAQFYHEHLAGTLLLKNLHEARRMARQCEKTCNDFERQTDSGTVEEWQAMKRRWERDSSKPDPYKLTEKRRPNQPHSH